MLCIQNTRRKEGCSIYIITYECELENHKVFELEVAPPAELADYLKIAERVSYHRYQIEYLRKHEIVCPRYSFADGSYVVVIAWFLIPGRPYPIQIYLHACALYSSVPDIGQRGAAEATRKKFKLAKFSHSTVSRSFKAFEQSRKHGLERRFGEEIGASIPNSVRPAAKAETTKAEKQKSTRSFPSPTAMTGRRKEMSVFLREVQSSSKTKEIEAASRRFVENWHKKIGRLLI